MNKTLKEIIKELVTMLEYYAETDLETLYNNDPEFVKQVREITDE